MTDCQHEWERRDHPHITDCEVRRCLRCSLVQYRVIPPEVRWKTSHLRDEDRMDFEWDEEGRE